MRKGLVTGLILGTAVIASPAAQAEITIAVAAPMTGDVAAFGEQFRVGAEQAVKDINEAGGVLGEPLALEIFDDACIPAQAVSVANQIASRGIPFVAGHFCSGSSIPASAVYADEGVVQISPGSTNPAFTDDRPGPGIYRVAGRDDQQGAIIAEYILENFPDANIAILDDKSAYGQGLAQETKRALNEAGKMEAMYDSYNQGDRDFSALISSMQAADIDLVMLGGYYTEGGLLVRQMAERGLEATLVGGDALFDRQFWAISGPAGEGTLMTFAPDPARDPANAEVVAEMTAAGDAPEGYALYTYAAIEAWVQAVEAAGSTEFDAVVEQLDNAELSTVLGEISFDEKGDVDAPPFVVYVWKSDGTWDYAQM